MKHLSSVFRMTREKSIVCLLCLVGYYAKGQELDRQKGHEVGADVYMTKPFDPEAILNKAREVLGLQ